MEIWVALAFLLIVIAFVKGFNINAKDIVTSLMKAGSRNKSFKKMKNPNHNRLQNFIRNMMDMMKETGQTGKFTFLVAAAMVLFVLGLALGISINNIFMSPVLAISLSSLPFIYIRIEYIRYNKLLIDELEVTLSAISMSIERTENIMSAIEENLEYIRPPIKRVFEEFLYTLKSSNPNMELAIDNMKRKIDHSVFQEWCDALKRCSNDRSLKYTLRPVVNKLSSIKDIIGEQRNILFKAVLGFWLLIALTVFILYLCFYVLPNSFEITMPQTLRNFVVACNALFIVLTGIKVTFESRDIKFDI